MIAGHAVLFTMRDHSEAALLARLATVLAQYPMPQPAAAATQGQEGYCSKHAVQMNLNEKNGQRWFSHKLATGDFCKGR
jgi:hypothetical protein